MDFRIADTFTDSLARLSGDEQKAVKTTAFDLQLNPANPGMSFHRLDRAKDVNFWSVRVSSDIRLIVHKTASSLLLCYVAHHDNAYRWAERRKLETHPKTGAAQFVEIRERIEEVAVPKASTTVHNAPKQRSLFVGVADDLLLSYGVPAEWLPDVRAVSEDSLLELAAHLPAEAAEALLELAIGGKPLPAQKLTLGANPFDHPDAQRRFRTMQDVEELERALNFPWDKWAVFLHPAQQQWVERDYAGPARVSGSAGTGKTVVALHRAVHLVRSDPDSRVLLGTFSTALANALHMKLRCLIGHQPHLAERLEVHSLDALAERLYGLQFGRARIASDQQIVELLQLGTAATRPGNFSPRLLHSEWDQVVDAWQLDSWDAYRDVRRLGRKTRLAEAQRNALWKVFEQVRAGLAAQGLVTRARMFARLATEMGNRKRPPFDFAVIDEAQDVSVAQLRFLAALGASRANGLFFAGDLGQRIFQQPFSWSALGVDVRGRSRTLNVNYRTSHQIRARADRLLAQEVADVDGNVEQRDATVSVFNGAHPDIRKAQNLVEERNWVSAWLRARREQNVATREMGVFVRSVNELERARAAVAEAGLPFDVIDERTEVASENVTIGTMHVAKGLEFRAVVVMACDDEIVPLQERIGDAGDDADLEDIYNTERQLLYVACTRARDYLLVTGAEPVSEFIDDLVAP